MKHLFVLLLFFAAVPAYAAQEEAPAPVTEKDILPYLEQVIGWSRAVSDTESLAANARETVLKDQLKQTSKKVLQKSFAFATAQSMAFVSVAPALDTAQDTDSRRTRLLKAFNNTNQRVADLQKRLQSRSLASSARERLNGELRLAKAQQDLIQTMVNIFSDEGNSAGTLADQINALSHTVLDESPEASKDKEEVAVKITAPKPDEPVQNFDGMFSLSTAMFSYSHKKSDIEKLRGQTAALAKTNAALIDSIRSALRAAIAEGNALSTSDTKPAEYRTALDALIVRYKRLSATIIPLGEVNVMLAGTDRSLQEWSRLIQENWNQVFRKLLVRLVILTIAVAIPLILSQLARRATKRYIHDPKRQKQIHVVRRTILFLVLTFVILANFISEFGSLATFAGFLTAGLAVALQTVLVSLVAHFFFFGRYGVRAGDRITVSGVTGDIVQIGMLRIYMRELSDEKEGWEATGKIVAFPNSILFQPTAFYKHVDER